MEYERKQTNKNIYDRIERMHSKNYDTFNDKSNLTVMKDVILGRKRTFFRHMKKNPNIYQLSTE